MNYREQLLQKINNLINGSWTVPEFEKQYYMFYIDQVPDEGLTDKEREFFGSVQEKLDYVVENPPTEDRQYGYINYAEYVEWLKKGMEDFLKKK